MSLLPASIKRIGSKTTENRWRHRFPHYKSLGAFCCHGNQSFDPLKFENLIKIGQLTSEIFKFESVMTTTDHWYTISSPCEPSAQVSEKLGVTTIYNGDHLKVYYSCYHGNHT